MVWLTPVAYSRKAVLLTLMAHQQSPKLPKLNKPTTLTSGWWGITILDFIRFIRLYGETSSSIVENLSKYNRLAKIRALYIWHSFEALLGFATFWHFTFPSQHLCVLQGEKRGRMQQKLPNYSRNKF